MVAERTPLHRSLRVKVFAVMLAVSFAPQLFVVAWSKMERNIAASLQENVIRAADDTVETLTRRREAQATDLPPLEGSLDDVASLHVVRVRLLSEHGRVYADVDRDKGNDLIHQIGTLFFGPDGAPTLREFDANLEPVLARPEVSDARVKDISSGCRTSAGSKLLVCHAVRYVEHGDGTDDIVYVQESSRRAVRALYDLRYQLARLTVITVPIALLLAWWMSRRIVTPIERLRRDALAKASSANPGGALVLEGRDEVADLARAFNQLLAQLAERGGANERFVADLVHEFKNPVAAIRVCADTLGDGPIDEAKSARIARVLKDSSIRLDTLVSQFLELARAEAGMPNEARGEVDLGALADGIVESMRVRHPGVQIDVDRDGQASVLGVSHRLDSVLRNLLENAVSFAPESGRVQVVVRRASENVVVSVSDNGPGISEEERPKMFTRFFTTRGRGSGLGLALVRAVVEAHGGNVSVVSQPGEGATFELRIPAI
ncbi:MAG: HAMP domain-containing sensor histidine kinase [Polyangiaceae bacterium]